MKRKKKTLIEKIRYSERYVRIRVAWIQIKFDFKCVMLDFLNRAFPHKKFGAKLELYKTLRQLGIWDTKKFINRCEELIKYDPNANVVGTFDFSSPKRTKPRYKSHKDEMNIVHQWFEEAIDNNKFDEESAAEARERLRMTRLYISDLWKFFAGDMHTHLTEDAKFKIHRELVNELLRKDGLLEQEESI